MVPAPRLGVAVVVRRVGVVAASVLAGALALPAAARGDTYSLVVSGASGSPAYVETYASWRQALVEVLRAQAEFRDDHLIVLAETPAPGVGRASREGVTEAFETLRRRMTADSDLLVVLLGHGTYDGVEAKFNLVGPDLAAADWNRLLDSLPGRAVFVNTTASSFPFVETLAREGRIVIAATASPVQRYDTVFPRFFVAAFDDAAADLDKDGRVSVWEAFASSSAQVRRWYEQEGRLATERAVLDDSGDGVGGDAERPGSDGQLASRRFVGAGVDRPAPAADASLAPLVARREALADRVAGLRSRKESMNAAAYARELEQVLVELARVSREIRQRTATVRGAVTTGR